MQRSKIAPHEIRTQMGADGDEILLMLEPYSIEGKMPSDSKYDPRMAGVGVRSRHSTPFEVGGLCTTHCVCVQISDGETEIYVISHYFPPTENIEVGIEQLGKVPRSLRGKKIIIGIDANAKSPLWCSWSFNDRGEVLEAVIAKYGLHVLNQPGQTATFETILGRSNINVTMASPEVIPLVKR